VTIKTTRSALLIVTLVLGILAALLPAAAQRPAIAPRVGVLAVSFSASSPMAETFRQAVRELGYAEGRNILIEWRYAGGRYDLLPGLAAELVGRKVDVIVTESTVATLAAKKAGATIPIVMALAADPVGSGLVRSLARPGGNITGLSMMLPELAAKRLELLKELVPRAARVAVLVNPDTPWHRVSLTKMRGAARALRVQPQFVEARAPDAFERAFAAMKSGRADALQVLGDPVFLNNRSRLLQLAERNRLPAIYEEGAMVHDGGLMAWGVNFAHLFQRAAWYVDKILRGAKPADLPIEQPTKFELVLNLKAAKALGLTIPQSLLLRADEVIR
jgi:putative ABC transport system substrate-binding protein